MPSPFPGMDPYLESYWGTVHHSVITHLHDQLNRKLPRSLRARIEERVFVESPYGYDRVVVPDIAVLERPVKRKITTGAHSAVGVVEPILIHFENDPITEGFIEIVEIGSRKRVITVIELLSISNKTGGPGQELYLQKQREVLDSPTSLVEIDLLRAGRRLLALPIDQIPPSHRTTYQVCVRRGWRPKVAEIYPVPLRQRLPIIRIPLRENDADAQLDLQEGIDLAYANGRFDDDLDYKAEPEPPLRPADEKWAAKLLREKGLR